MDLKLVMQLFLKDIIEIGSINFHKKYAVEIHHITHRRNI